LQEEGEDEGKEDEEGEEEASSIVPHPPQPIHFHHLTLESIGTLAIIETKREGTCARNINIIITAIIIAIIITIIITIIIIIIIECAKIGERTLCSRQ